MSKKTPQEEMDELLIAFSKTAGRAIKSASDGKYTKAEVFKDVAGSIPDMFTGFKGIGTVSPGSVTPEQVREGQIRALIAYEEKAEQPASENIKAMVKGFSEGLWGLVRELSD